MAGRDVTPSPRKGASMSSMAPPATPGGRDTSSSAPKTPGGSASSSSNDTAPRTPGGGSTTVAPCTPGASESRSSTLSAINTPNGHPIPFPATPGGTRSGCTSDSAEYKIVTVHTAKCTECDKRNMATMLRCPGCTFQICKPCRDRRQKLNKDLSHGMMLLSPGGPGLGMSSPRGLGSGGAVRRRVIGLGAAPAPPQFMKEASAVIEDAQMADAASSSPASAAGVKAKGKAKATPAPSAGKKRSAKSKPKPILVNESSDDDDFMPDLASPTTHKRRRTELAITDTPTATSARPSRKAPASAAKYATPSSPGTETSTDVEASVGRRASEMTDAEIQESWNVDIADPAPAGRIQELLEQHGVNTPSNRKAVPRAQEHLNEARRDDSVPVKAASPHTVRDFIVAETPKYQNKDLSIDENDELVSGIKETARKWAGRTFDSLSLELQTKLARNLDLRLDLLDPSHSVHLLEAVHECAARKLAELEQERRPSSMAPRTPL